MTDETERLAKTLEKMDETVTAIDSTYMDFARYLIAQGIGPVETANQLKAELAEKDRHIDILANKVEYGACGCGLDNPDDVCLVHAQLIEDAKREQMEADCRAMCRFCKDGDKNYILRVVKRWGRWVHESPSLQRSADCGAADIRIAWGMEHNSEGGEINDRSR